MIRRLGVTVLFCILACGSPPAAPPAAAPTSVSFVETIDDDWLRYKVIDAEGRDQEAAKLAAARAATMFAALHLTGSDAEKAGVESNKVAVLALADVARIGRVLKVYFVGAAERMDLVVDIDAKALRRHLEEKNLITKTTELAASLDNPMILIRKEGSAGADNPPSDRYIVDRIAGFFTQRRFAMVDEAATKNAAQMSQAAESLSGLISDPIAEVAAASGADIYVTYTAGFTATVKASASLKAYETTTGRLLASATGQSRQYPAGTPEMDALQEAVSDGIPKIFEDISGYWHDDIAHGKRYLFSISGDLSDRERAKALRKGLEKIGQLKLDLKTPTKFGGTIRAKGSANDIEDAVEAAIKGAGFRNVKVPLSTRSLFVFDAE